MKKLLILMTLVVLTGICFAQVYAPHPDWVTFEVDETRTIGTIRWSTTPSDLVDLYYLSIMPDDIIYTPGPGGHPDWNGGGLPGMAPTLDACLESPGVYKFTSPNVLLPTKNYIAYVAAVTLPGWDWDAGSIASSYHNLPPEPLPVELSSFSATMTAARFVNISWTSQTETNMLGYRIYRAESPNLAEAVKITPTLIQATNTSITHTYNHEDQEVVPNTSYWYWLESVDCAGEKMHGPSNVTVTGNEPATPGLYDITSILNLYPNPLRSGQTLTMDVVVKAGEKANATIYNTRGQAVSTFNLNEGNHKLAWNGFDKNGNQCSSGVYYFKIGSESTNQTRKLMLVK